MTVRLCRTRALHRMFDASPLQCQRASLTHYHLRQTTQTDAYFACFGSTSGNYDWQRLFGQLCHRIR